MARTEASTAALSRELIKSLLDAEQKADQIIADAKKSRLSRLRQAKDKVDEELRAFRQEIEAKFEKDFGDKARIDPGASTRAASEHELQKVGSDYNANKLVTVEYVCSKVLEVTPTLTSTQAQGLASGFV
mmetsp:Transcript_85622/g.242823  ORF Transcript_85622/g.242823 Transcript_85622/m.242823 type:complete len:130 (-) Transcript_85622:210-599(-)